MLTLNRRRTDIPVYSFEKHQRLEKTISLYSPHVIVLEGILALHDPRIMEMLDLKVYMEADADLCLSRRIVRDVRERGRTIEGTIKQWFSSVKPAFTKFVEPQREGADLIVPRGMMNKIAISMIVGQTRQILKDKSLQHRADLERLGQGVEDQPLSKQVFLLEDKPQIKAIMTLLRNPATSSTEFTFYTDRLAALLVEKALDCHNFLPSKVRTPGDLEYSGLRSAGTASAITVLRGGGCMEIGLKRTIPDCMLGRILIQTNYRTGEPELHYLKLFPNISSHETVLLLDPQMSSGGAALMAVKVLVDHGVSEKRIVFVTFMTGKRGVNRLTTVFPGIKVVTCEVIDDYQRRWIEDKYFGC